MKILVMLCEEEYRLVENILFAIDRTIQLIRVRNSKELKFLLSTEGPNLLITEPFFDEQNLSEQLEMNKIFELPTICISNNLIDALKVIQEGAFDFVLRSNLSLDLQRSIKRFCSFSHSQSILNLDEQFKGKLKTQSSNTVMVWEGDRMRPIELNHIVKIKSDGAYSEIYLKEDKRIYTSKNIGVFEDLLKEMKFLRIHHSCIVNLDHVSYYKPGIRAFVTLNESDIEYVSKSKKKHLLRYFNVRKV
ncbi:MAG: LytTR family transcriptional regulator [Bacteroidia bacterium]|nr:LytTR family transcriptional regulator [Bacteroidia bacterium]